MTGAGSWENERVHSYGRMEDVSWRYLQQIVPHCLQGQNWVFLHLLPISHKNPKLSNNLAQLWADIVPPVACKEELKMCNIWGITHPDNTDLICDILDSPAWNFCSGRLVRWKAMFNKIAYTVRRGWAGGRSKFEQYCVIYSVVHTTRFIFLTDIGRRWKVCEEAHMKTDTWRCHYMNDT